MSFHGELYQFIPQNHLLVKVNELVDFSFILDFVKDEYDLYYGRRARKYTISLMQLFS
jgi:hypothetical protein